MSVAALYVDKDGPYPELVSDWYDAERDARTYAGTGPVVAHPPCGPWGQLHHLCTRQDKTLGPAGVAQVRKHGGVLEHPAYSKLWAACEMPKPGWLPDPWGGWTLHVEQWRWGHNCVKPTWLYIVGTNALPARPTWYGCKPDGRPQNFLPDGRPKLSKPGITSKSKGRHLSPPLFAEWLVELAAMCEAPA